MYAAIYSHPVLGELVIASDGEAITGLWLSGQKYFEAGVEGSLKRADDLPALLQARAWLNRYFSGDPLPVSALPLAPRGTDFQKRVWKILTKIPYGQLTSYGAIAQRIERETGRRTSARAVGGAVGHNPISIIVPCHRVVGANGSLTGYAGGLDRKIWLLRHEGADVAALSRPAKGTAL